MEEWKKWIETINHPMVRRRYPLTNVLKNKTEELSEEDRAKELTELKKFIVENSPFPPKTFKKPYFKSKTGVLLYFPNVFTFYPNECDLKTATETLITSLFPEGVPEALDRKNYVGDLLTEVEEIVKEIDVTNVQSIYQLFEGDKIKSLTHRIRTDLKEGDVKPKELIDDLIETLEPLLEKEDADKDLLNLIYGILFKLKNNEELEVGLIAPILCKFQNLLS